MSNYLFLLDRAHGKDTPGKSSPELPDGRTYYEWDMSDIVVCELMKLCKEHNIDAVDLVPEDNDVSLSERVNRANKIARNTSKKCVFISPHSNAARGEGWQNAKGWEVWTSKGQTNSDIFADILYAEAKKQWGDDIYKRYDTYTDNDYDKEANFTVLRDTIMAAVLTENFFHNNLEETKKLLLPSFRKEIAVVHFAAMLNLEVNQPF